MAATKAPMAPATHTSPGPLTAMMPGGQERAQQHPDAFHGAGDAVGRRELLGRVGEGREQRALRRPGERDRGGEARPPDVHQRRRGVEEHRGGRGRVRGRLDQVPHQQHALARVAVREGRGERREGGRGQQLDQRDDADRGGPGRLVRVDEDRDPGPELGRVEREVRDEHATKGRVPDHGAEHARRGAGSESGHPASVRQVPCRCSASRRAERRAPFDGRRWDDGRAG